LNHQSNLPDQIDVLCALGALLFGLGWLIETIADQQKYRFKQDPSRKGQFITSGLWKYSRHPNYFGEVTLWWGIFLISAVASPVWLSLLSPLTITFLLLKVSGIPMLEAKYEGNQAYEAYKAKTSAFIPLPPKSKQG
jgi:steroid 5-alpha reductase family enzyme